ncbi:hexose kinase [Oscillospiraceae bacterium MB08-C2-2]|nr:hexose kinase [Oscillospiraceae bacterium MB08-C2-2]
MIRSICLNPVIDRMYYIDDFIAGKLHKGIAPLAYPGGKGVNIARVVSLLGEPCALYGFLGGLGGQLIAREMEQLDVQLRTISLEGECRVTINIMDRKNNRETEITEPGPAVSPQELARFFAELEQDTQPGDVVICSGSAVAGMPEDVYKTVSEICARKKAECFLDTSAQYLSGALPGNYRFAKPNANELNFLFGLSGKPNLAEMVKLGQRAREQGIGQVLISMGGEGGLLVEESRALLAEIPPVETVSTIGSGDSTVAGFAVGVSRGLAPEDCLRLAMACGVCNATYSKVGFVEKEQVKQLTEKIRLKAI